MRDTKYWISILTAALLTVSTAIAGDWNQRFKESKYSKHEGFGSWAGPILLQDHNDEVWFQSVQIRKL